MGYWSDDKLVAVTASIEPGPRARHARSGFEPDQKWQTEKIAQHYAASGRIETYLGDWHTHPDALAGGLSQQDKRTLLRIAQHAKARAAKPLMVVLCGGPSDWEIYPWVGLRFRDCLEID